MKTKKATFAVIFLLLITSVCVFSIALIGFLSKESSVPAQSSVLSSRSYSAYSPEPTRSPSSTPLASHFNKANLASIRPRATATPIVQKLDTYTSTFHPPCYVYYPYSKSTYIYYVSESDCAKFKSDANILIPTSTPLSIPAIPDNTLEKRHLESCNKAASEWTNLRNQWTLENSDKFSSSTEEYNALVAYKNQYQQELNSAGCTNTISL